MKVLVTGGRDYADKLRVWAALHEIEADTPISHLIEGGATGADAHARSWALSTNGVQSVQCPANWGRYGAAAGPRRNAAMLGLSPDLVMAFPGGRGTASMVRLAKASGFKVIEYSASQTEVPHGRT